jgi:superfamily II DNA or RNA helicase
LASTGLNIKRIFNLFLIDAAKSYIQVIQSIGRGLRKAFDKGKVRVYDVHCDFKFAKKHAKARKKHYKAKGYGYVTRSVDYIELIGE